MEETLWLPSLTSLKLSRSIAEYNAFLTWGTLLDMHYHSRETGGGMVTMVNLVSYVCLPTTARTAAILKHHYNTGHVYLRTIFRITTLGFGAKRAISLNCDCSISSPRVAHVRERGPGQGSSSQIL